jgi:hypothetical protein
METNRDRQVAGVMLFMLGGLAGTALALRWGRRRDSDSVGGTLQGLHAVLDDAVETVESTVSEVRRLVSPFHDLLEEAAALAAGVHRTLDSYRQLRSSDRHREAGYVPSMAPEGTRGGGYMPS